MNTNERITLDTLTKKRDELRAQGAALLADADALLAEADTIERAINLLGRDASSRSSKSGEVNTISQNLGAELPDSISIPDIDAAFLASLKGMSQPRATIALAKHCGGLLRPFDLEKVLIAAGIMKKTRYSPNIASRLLANSPRFERVALGLYRLIASKPDKPEVVVEKKADAMALRTIQ